MGRRQESLGRPPFGYQGRDEDGMSTWVAEELTVVVDANRDRQTNDTIFI